MSPLATSIDTFLALAAVLINFAFAVVVLTRTRRTTQYLTFSFICLSIMFWNFCDFMVVASGNPLWPPAGAGSESAWKYFNSSGSSMAVAFLFHFVNAVAMTEKRNKPWIVLAYAVAVFFAVISPLALIYQSVKPFVDGAAYNIAFFAGLFPFIIASIAIVIVAYGKADSADEKSRLFYILTAIVILVFAGLTDLFQIAGVPVPPLGHLGSVLASSILAVGVFRHRKSYDIFTQLQSRLESLGELAASIAHEIRNPLSSIRLTARSLANNLGDSSNSTNLEKLDIIIEEIGRIDNILRNFQYFTRPLNVEKERVSMNNLLEKTVKLVENDVPNITIRLESTGSGAVNADASLLKQVFLNIIKNAREACGKGGKLSIKTEHSPPMAANNIRG
jgi:signal transduction histidine kinase